MGVFLQGGDEFGLRGEMRLFEQAGYPAIEAFDHAVGLRGLGRDQAVLDLVFHSSLVPPYVRKARRVEAALPWLYLKGISTGQMQEALEVLLGPEAKGLSAAVSGRLKRQWEGEHEDWRRQDMCAEKNGAEGDLPTLPRSSRA